MAVALFGREGGSSCGGWFVNAVEALGEVWGGPATAREAGGPRLAKGGGRPRGNSSASSSGELYFGHSTSAAAALPTPCSPLWVTWIRSVRICVAQHRPPPRPLTSSDKQVCVQQGADLRADEHLG